MKTIKNMTKDEMVLNICDDYLPYWGMFGDCFSDENKDLAQQIAEHIKNAEILKGAHLAHAVMVVCSAAVSGGLDIIPPAGSDFKELDAALRETIEHTGYMIAETLAEIKKHIEARAADYEDIEELMALRPYISPQDVNLIEWAQ